ncbi:hypothetical protein MRX96_051080, partial [Rhipicephalus microplus]
MDASAASVYHEDASSVPYWPRTLPADHQDCSCSPQNCSHVPASLGGITQLPKAPKRALNTSLAGTVANVQLVAKGDMGRESESGKRRSPTGLFWCYFPSQRKQWLPGQSTPLPILCDLAQYWANHLAHTDDFYYRKFRDVGENLFCRWSYVPDFDVTGEQVARYWYSEIKYYDF